MSEASDGAGVDPHSEDTLRTIKEALEHIDYGSIVITIHQGEVVTIETSTKVRPPRKKGARA